MLIVIVITLAIETMLMLLHIVQSHDAVSTRSTRIAKRNATRKQREFDVAVYDIRTSLHGSN